MCKESFLQNASETVGDSGALGAVTPDFCCLQTRGLLGCLKIVQLHLGTFVVHLGGA